MASDQPHATARARQVPSKCGIKSRPRADDGTWMYPFGHKSRPARVSRIGTCSTAREPPPDRSPMAQDTLRAWVRSGGFHNTTGKTSLMCDQMGHHLSENDLRLPQGRKAPRKYKWSDSAAQTAEHGRMRPDPSGRKPSRFPNQTPRAGPGPSH